MAFDLTIGTERAQALQNAIQDELQKRGFTPDPDPTMAEYITIMLINNKTSEQITAELEDLIGSGEYDASFTDWLFTEATAKSESSQENTSTPAVTQQAAFPTPEPQSRSTAPARATPIYNQALNQALPSGSSAGQKRTASGRSSSPPGGHPNKSRRTDTPTGPRSMHGGQGNRSLLDRMGGRTQGGQRNPRDDIQARIEAVTHQNAMAAMGGGQVPPGFNGMGAMNGMGMPGQDMNAFSQGMNPMALQEMMMNQMALMAQMASNMGMLNGQNPMMSPNGLQQNANMQTGDGHAQGQQGNSRRGGGVNRGRGRGGSQASHRSDQQPTNIQSTPATPATFAAPTPIPAQAPSTPLPAGLTPPERPQSPSLCKFGLKCTNALCRYSHASPVATPESGVVLSFEPCEAGVNCGDKDCVKAHVSPAAKGVTSVPQKTVPKAEAPSALKPPCRYGANCTKVASGSCPFSHPFVPKAAGPAVQCRFGAACTRVDCHFQHPAGRVLPNSFHRGLAETGPTVSVKAPQTGSMDRPSVNRTVIFNKPAIASDKTKDGKAGGENATVEATA